MIIDSHAHYAFPRFDAEVPYLCEENGAPIVRCADREGLLRAIGESGVVGVIEPSIGFDAIEKQMALVSEHPTAMWAAVGVHPTRCVRTAWKNRKRLKEYAKRERVVAIGETGLDYHCPKEEQHRARQKRWFVYQLRLAHRMRLPVVLHVRMADEDALKILKRYKGRLHGGVAHCFKGDRRLAEEYIALGLAIGVGGTLLHNDGEGRALCDAVKHVPLTSILVETDAPFVLPDVDEGLCSKNQRRKLCNASTVLPAVIRRIAELRGEPCDMVEDAIYRNTLRVFRLHGDV